MTNMKSSESVPASTASELEINLESRGSKSICMQIALINRETNKHYWVSEYHRPTTEYKFAVFTTDVVKVSKLVKKFIDKYKVIVVDMNGEVIRKYD